MHLVASAELQLINDVCCTAPSSIPAMMAQRGDIAHIEELDPQLRHLGHQINGLKSAALSFFARSPQGAD